MFRNWTNARILLAPDGDGGGDGGNNAGDVEISFQKALDKRNNDAVALARQLFDDNYSARRRNRELSDELREAKTKVPAEGSVVLSTEQAAQWAAYQALGNPEEVKNAIDEKSTLQGQLDSMARNTILRDVAEKSGFKFSVLQTADDLAKSRGKNLTYELREVEEDGAKVMRAFVKDGDTQKPLGEYAQEQWADLMPALVVQSDTQTQTGTPYPGQYAGNGGHQQPTARTQTLSTLNKAYAKPKG